MLTTAHGAHHRDGHVAVSDTRNVEFFWAAEAPCGQKAILLLARGLFRGRPHAQCFMLFFNEDNLNFVSRLFC